MAPQVTPSANFGSTLMTMKVRNGYLMTPWSISPVVILQIHYQSSTNELEDLKVSIPQSAAAYKAAGLAAGSSAALLARTLTLNKTPSGGHCAL